MSAPPAQPTTPRPSLQTVLTRTYLVLIFLWVGITSLLLTLLAMLALRGSVAQSLNVIALSMSYNAEAAVVFHDPSAAQRSLASIAGASTDEVAAASIHDMHGNLLAQWHRPTQASKLESLLLDSVDWLMPAKVTTTIRHDNVAIGTLTVTGYGGRLLRLLLVSIAELLVCLALSVACVFFVIRRLADRIVAPLKELARTTHAIRDERAFNRRVPAAPISELNELENDFNALLAELDTWERKNQREHERLTLQATRDDLTGLLKRSAFDDNLRSEVEDASVRGLRVGVLFIDVDAFKQINDSFGHPAGDAILVEVARKISAQLREGDLAARLGGDEFAVMLRSIRDAHDAANVAIRLQNSLAEPLLITAGQHHKVSISIGVAVFPDHAQSADALMAAADAAMYRAKRDPVRGWFSPQAEHVARTSEGET